MQLPSSLLRNVSGSFLAATCFLVLSQSAKAGLIAYPTKDAPSFLIEVSEEWKLEPAEEVGGYFTVTGPTGVVISFRTIDAKTEKEATASLKDAIAESAEFLNENYKDVKLEEPKDDKAGDLPGFYVVGTGKDKEDGSAWVFGMGWYALKDGKIGEIWFTTTADDKDGMAAAQKVLETFKAP